MKNRYFGDNRDLFKYDLIYQIIRAVLVNHFTVIPMLTGNDDKGHGEKRDRDKARAGKENRDLMSFLDECVAEGRRDIKQLESFFKNQCVKMKVYQKGFSHQQRGDYFKQAENELLPKSLVLVDPDTGLEVKRSGEKHVLYSEVKSLYEHMDKGSILMIYQHFPRANHPEYLNWRAEALKEKVTGDYPVCIDDNEIIFFFLTKDDSLEHSLTHLVGDYAESYSK